MQFRDGAYAAHSRGDAPYEREYAYGQHYGFRAYDEHKAFRDVQVDGQSHRCRGNGRGDGCSDTYALRTRDYGALGSRRPGEGVYDAGPYGQL